MLDIYKFDHCKKLEITLSIRGTFFHHPHDDVHLTNNRICLRRGIFLISTEICVKNEQISFAVFQFTEI